MNRRKISKTMIHQITQKRIETLFSLANLQIKKGNINLANRYILHARNLSMKNVVPIPRELKRLVCKHCYSYLYPSVTCQIRIHKGRIIKYCLHCKKITRFPFK